MSNKEQKIIKFEDVKERISKAIESSREESGIREETMLVEGFLNEPFSKELSNSIIIGGPSVPMVILVGKASGRIYFFALKALIGDVWK